MALRPCVEELADELRLGFGRVGGRGRDRVEEGCAEFEEARELLRVEEGRLGDWVMEEDEVGREDALDWT